MYTILITDQNEMITTVRERIMQRSKLVDNLHFLMEPTYKSFDMTKFTAVMEYITPVGRELKTEYLTLSPERYKDMLEYKLPFDTNLTKEAGDVEIQLTFTFVEMDANGMTTQHVRKISSTHITIIPVAAWCSVVGDEALSALDKRIIELDARINAINDIGAELDATKADDISYNEEDNSLQLIANNKLIGQKVYLKNSGSASGIAKIRIDDDGSLVVVYSDGTEEVVGKLSGDCAGIYIPSLEEDKLTFTLSDKATEEVISIDINPDNEWSDDPTKAADSDYVWNTL